MTAAIGLLLTGVACGGAAETPADSGSAPAAAAPTAAPQSSGATAPTSAAGAHRSASDGSVGY